MYNIYSIYPLLLQVLCYCCDILCKLEIKYVNSNSIIMLKSISEKYDNIHSIYELSCIFNIKIVTYTSKNFIKNKIYINNNNISELTIIKQGANKSIHNKIKVLQTLFFLDDLDTINTLILYNCGIIIHSNFHINHIYNYMGHRRNIERLENYEDIENIKYI